MMKCQVCGIEREDVERRVVEINAPNDKKYNEEKMLCKDCQKKVFIKSYPLS